ncbi:MAG: AsmA family protein [Thiomicrospira sp.]|uniref:AsmA family protein n=1 Tax=Thiomicrospira sp. TaxID=935 RepID=UPI001A07E39B|nr:AsmA family protein [Thiomicrospira sp.]MBE0494464.1 AsmA family protein [Thiomicrospira sp.]
MRHKINRGLKILVVVFFLVPVFVLAAFFGAVSLIDFNQYKPMIEQEVAVKTGYKLRIEGDIETSVIPLQLKIGQSQLGYAEFDSDEPLLAFEKINLRVSLAALLLQAKVHLLGVELFEPRLHLKVDEQGKTNWGANLASANTETAPRFERVNWQTVNSTPEKVIEQSAQMAERFDIKLSNVTLYDGLVSWRNPARNQHYELSNIELMAFDIELGQGFDLQMQGQLKNQHTGQSFQVDQQGHMSVAKDMKSLSVQKLNADVSIFWPQDMDRTELKIQLDLSGLNWRQVDKSIDIESVRLKALDTDMSLSFSGHYGDKLDLDGRVDMDYLNPRQWLNYFKLPYPEFVDKQALSQLKGGFNWQLTPQKWQLEDMALTLDKTDLKGYFNFQHGAQPSYQFELALDQLNMDFYAATVTTSTDTTSVTTGDSTPKADQVTSELVYLPIGVPVTTLRESQVQGQLQIDALQIWQAHYQQVHMGFNSQYGKMDIAPFDADLYDGRWRSQFSVDVNSDTPHYQLKGRLDRLNAQAFLRDVANYDLLTGTLSSHFDLRTAGSNLDAIKYNMNGLFRTDLADGAYLGVDLNRLLIGQPIQQGDATRLEKLSLSGQVVKGIYHLQQASLKSERFDAVAFGKVHLPNATLEAELQLTYQQPPEGLAILKGVTIPVKLSGSIMQPDWQVDIDKLLGADNLQRLMRFFN